MKSINQNHPKNKLFYRKEKIGRTEFNEFELPSTDSNPFLDINFESVIQIWTNSS